MFFIQIKLEEELMMFEIRDQSKTFNRVASPYAVYDGRDSVLLKIGEKESMESYFETIQASYRFHGLDEEADDICLMELPKDQEEIDKVFQICDYIGVLHRQIMLH
jgi:hypothetical protein